MNNINQDSNEYIGESQTPLPEAVDIDHVLQLKRTGLASQLIELEQTIVSLQKEYSTQLDVLQTRKKSLEEALSHVEALLRFEGQDSDPSKTLTHNDKEEYPTVTLSITDAAYDFLVKKGAPAHFKDIANHLLQMDIRITGKDPAATLLSRIVRDRRFKRTKKRGTYALSEWHARRGTPAVRKKGQKARKKHRFS